MFVSFWASSKHWGVLLLFLSCNLEEHCIITLIDFITNLWFPVSAMLWVFLDNSLMCVYSVSFGFFFPKQLFITSFLEFSCSPVYSPFYPSTEKNQSPTMASLSLCCPFSLVMVKFLWEVDWIKWCLVRW